MVYCTNILQKKAFSSYCGLCSKCKPYSAGNSESNDTFINIFLMIKLCFYGPHRLFQYNDILQIYSISICKLKRQNGIPLIDKIIPYPLFLIGEKYKGI